MAKNNKYITIKITDQPKLVEMGKMVMEQKAKFICFHDEDGICFELKDIKK